MPTTATILELEADLLAQYRSRTPRSAALHTRATAVMPGGDTRAGTFYLPYPIVMVRGDGCRLWDEDGNEYLDLLGNFTSLIHGHAPPAVNAAIQAQLSRGTAHGAPTQLMTELAERLCSRVASVERVRFCNSGTEAALFALRAARAFTRRSIVVKMEGGYHGSYDQMQVALSGRYGESDGLGLSPGATREVVAIPFNDLARATEVLRARKNEVAAVIVEPVMMAGGVIPARPDYLAGLCDLTREIGAIFILDEVATFRLSYGGAQDLYGVTPDLTCFGKTVGGGLAAGAFGGRADIMGLFDPSRAGTIAHSGTYNGSALAMAAGIATLDLYTRDRAARLNEAGDKLRGRLQEICDRVGLVATLTGTGSLIGFHPIPGPVVNAHQTAGCDRAIIRALHLALLSRGIFTASRQMYVLSTPMLEQGDPLREFESAFGESVEAIASALGGKSAGS